MKPIRVLVVDDSVVVRRILRDVLAEDPAFEVVGVAANGKIALSMVEQVSPDVVTLDVEMPDMDGIEVLRRLRVSSPALPVIMFSTLTQRGAEATLDALALGARDYVTKPANIGSISVGMQRIREELLPKLKGICGFKTVPPASASTTFTAKPASTLAMPERTGPLDIVVIGSSTGGPNALSEILPQLPADFPVPVVIVQHMPPTFTKFLAERLNASCALRVLEAGVDEKLQPGTIWIAPGDYHVSVYSQGTSMRLRRHQAPPENSCRPAVDVLFRTTAMTYGGRALAVILTGMGQDGLRGAQELKSVNAKVIAQDEASSVVWGMPGFVVQAGLADRVVPLWQMAQEITRRVVTSQKLFAVHG